MSRDAAVVVALVLLSASWALAHMVLLWRVARARTLPVWARLLALLPVATPLLALRAGVRMLPLLWLLFGAAYVATRVLF